MDVTPNLLLARLHAQRDWQRLLEEAKQIAGSNPGNAEAWRYWGIAELMLMRGGPDKLLRASLLNDFEASLWLGVIQEFATHPPGDVTPHDLLAQVELAKIRRSPYLDYPQEVHIETLALCNAACSFCPYPTMERQGERMPDALIDKIIDDLKAIPPSLPFNVSPFKVNEPLLDKRIFAVCDKITRSLPNAQLRMFTNGSPLTPKLIERIAALAKLTNLWVSLNEVEPTRYEALMQLPLERTLRNLDTLHTLMQDKRFPHPVVVSRVIDGSERDQAFLDFLARRFPLFQPFLIGTGNWSGQVAVGGNRRVPSVGCWRWYEVSIMASGKVALCCMDGEGKHVIGDVNRQSVLDVYNAPAYRKMRQYTFSRKAAAAPCDTCIYP
ncbi:MAG: SPASM domain-containing protein [Hyphomicrobiales bacterium]|nr:SPASM domain-containing protein [Hyphomicrobiales bacterium]